MRYWIKPRDIIYVKGYGFLSFAENMGKSLSNKYGQKLLDSAKKSTTDAMNTASKRSIQKSAEATGDFIGNKIADKIRKVLKKTSNNNIDGGDDDDDDDDDDEDAEITIHRKILISRGKTTNYWWINVNIKKIYISLRKVTNYC